MEPAEKVLSLGPSNLLIDVIFEAITRREHQMFDNKQHERQIHDFQRNSRWKSGRMDQHHEACHHGFTAIFEGSAKVMAREKLFESRGIEFLMNTSEIKKEVWTNVPFVIRMVCFWHHQSNNWESLGNPENYICSAWVVLKTLETRAIPRNCQKIAAVKKFENL